MAGSQYAYVRNFELPDPVLPNTYMVVRIDGKGFHRFSEQHGFAKPNDPNALELMNKAAFYVMESLRPDISLAFGESDEYSFLLRKSCTLYKRRQSKIVTHIVSLFTSSYVFFWSQYFPHQPLIAPPSFDGRLVVYPSEKEVRDYFSWRQADTHINNLYNTTFWALVLKGNLSEREAHKSLEGTVSSQKNEILFSKYSINYGKLPALYRKGTTIAWDPQKVMLSKGNKSPQRTPRLRILHIDIIGKSFWQIYEDQDAVSANDSQESLSDWEHPNRQDNFSGLGDIALK